MLLAVQALAWLALLALVLLLARHAQRLCAARLPGLFVPMAPGRLHGQHARPALTGSAAVGLHSRAVQKLEGQIKVAESADQALMRGTGAQAETAAMATAHDLDHGQAGHVLVGRGPGHQTQPTPALMLPQKIGQQHHHHAGQRVMKGGKGFHDGVRSSSQGGENYLAATLDAAKAGLSNSGKSLAMGAPFSGL